MRLRICAQGGPGSAMAQGVTGKGTCVAAEGVVSGVSGHADIATALLTADVLLGVVAVRMCRENGGRDWQSFDVGPVKAARQGGMRMCGRACHSRIVSDLDMLGLAVDLDVCRSQGISTAIRWL